MTAYTKGWTDIDPVVVDTAVYEGWGGYMTIGERFLAIVRLTDLGLSQVEIAKRLNITDRTVDRMQKRRREGLCLDCEVW